MLFRCRRYGVLPSNCHLAADSNDQCCQKVECSPTGPTTCADRLTDCASYGEYACKTPYDGWAKDNCAQRCGLCPGQGKVVALVKCWPDSLFLFKPWQTITVTIQLDMNPIFVQIRGFYGRC